MDKILLYGGTAVIVVACIFASFINRPGRPATPRTVKQIVAATAVGAVGIIVGSILNTSASTAGKSLGVLSGVICLAIAAVALVAIAKRYNARPSTTGDETN